MNMINEREESVYKYDFDMSEEDYEMLRVVGLERIKHDDRALVEYAIVAMLEDQIRQIDAVEE